MRLIKARRIAEDKILIRVFVQKHGVHIGQEGREGEVGGSQAGYEHVAGGENWKTMKKGLEPGQTGFYVEGEGNFWSSVHWDESGKITLMIYDKSDPDYWEDYSPSTIESAVAAGNAWAASGSYEDTEDEIKKGGTKKISAAEGLEDYLQFFEESMEEEQSDADRWAKENFPGLTDMNESETLALETYKSGKGEYLSLNKALREGDESKFQPPEEDRDYENYDYPPNLQEIRDGLDAAISKGTIPNDMILWRGINGERIANIIERGEFTVGNTTVGRGFQDNAFVSTGMTPLTAQEFMSSLNPAVIRIRTPAGINAAYMEPFSQVEMDENELLLERGLIYELLDDQPSDSVDIGGRTLDVWEVQVARPE